LSLYLAPLFNSSNIKKGRGLKPSLLSDLFLSA